MTHKKMKTERSAAKNEFVLAGLPLFLLGLAYGLLGMGLGMIAALMPASAVDWASAVLTLVTGFGLGVLALVRLAADKAKTARQTIKKMRQDTDGVSPVIAVVLKVAITVVLAATVFVLVSDVGSPNAGAPSMNFNKDDAAGNLTVISVSQSGLDWGAFDVQGCTGVPSGTVTAGDVTTDCSGDVFIRHIESESLVYQTSFA